MLYFSYRKRLVLIHRLLQTTLKAVTQLVKRLFRRHVTVRIYTEAAFLFAPFVNIGQQRH